MASSVQVVVITGASSGIGRASAIEFAKGGWHVVLAGRRSQALERAAHQCREAGGSARAVPTDVTREQDVQQLVALALEQTGRIDVWVNNAGVTAFGALEDIPLEEHRQVIEVNLFGALHGARAVLPVFRRQRQGVLINMGSVLSQIGQPFVPSYVISKFALRGLTEALRAELAHEPEIHICSLLPYAVDTEHFESGANHTGRDAHAMPPALSPEQVARALVQLANHPARERHVPRVAVLGLALHAVFPRAVERVVGEALARWHLGHDHEPHHPGNLFDPRHAGGSARGERPPLVSTARLLAFGLPRLVTVQLGLLWRGLAPKRRTSAAAPPPRSVPPAATASIEAERAAQ
jgi:short-subunit dehydrogenase